ncbi:hypothetical protein Sjap_024284 [Stephania japonica]|uniref:Uncharacterized protein n=1 Tax=Stephania japonica TaxID=461633 RepID=A0AAP0HNK1_9MAGN
MSWRSILLHGATPEFKATTNDAEFETHDLMTSLGHWFRHAIGNLIFGGNIANIEELFEHFVPNEVNIDFDVFGARMEDRILGKRKCTLIVAPKNRFGGREEMSVC